MPAKPPHIRLRSGNLCILDRLNPMSNNRRRSITSLQAVAGVPVVLVTPENLPQFIQPNAPLHPAFEYLSLVHKSDYLRCYFMHHLGGGYSDIKPCRHNWLASFEQLEASPAYAIGWRAQARLGFGAGGRRYPTRYESILFPDYRQLRLYLPTRHAVYPRLVSGIAPPHGFYADELKLHPAILWAITKAIRFPGPIFWAIFSTP